MTDTSTGPWWVVAAAAAPSIASGVWVVWKWWTERADRADDSEHNAEERQFVRLEKERQSLSTGQQQLFENLSGENTRLRGELVDTRKDRDRGWAFARRCEVKMHDLYHKLMNTRQTIDIERFTSKKSAVEWPIETPLPNDQESAV